MQQPANAANSSYVAGARHVRALINRDFLRACVTATAWASLVTLIFFVLSILSLRTDNAVELARVHEAFVRGVVTGDKDAFLLGNTDIGAHQWNDCLVLHQAIDRRATTEQLVISPLDISPSAETTTPCGDTAAIASGQTITRPGGFYHRYLHGHTVLTRLFLAVVSVSGIRHLYSGIIVFMLMLGIAQTIITMTKGQRVEEGCFWLTTFFIVLRFYGLETFGQSLAHGPSDMVLIGFLLFLAIGSARGGIDTRQIPTAAAIFGALTIIFEFLTGGIPLGLAVLIGALPFALRPSDASAREPLARSIGLAVVAFLVASVVVFLIKAVLVVIVFGPGFINDTLQQLAFRMGLVATPAFGDATPTGLKELMRELLINLDALAAGETFMTLLMLGVSVTAGIWATRTLVGLGRPAIKARAIALASSNLLIVGWIIVFMQHTTQHARFMDRILVWTISSGLALFVLAMVNGPKPAEHIAA